MRMGICVEKSYHSRLSLERTACKVSPTLASGKLDLGRVFLIPRIDKRDSPCLNSVHTRWFMLSTCLSSGSLEV